VETVVCRGCEHGRGLGLGSRGSGGLRSPVVFKGEDVIFGFIVMKWLSR